MVQHESGIFYVELRPTSSEVVDCSEKDTYDNAEIARMFSIAKIDASVLIQEMDQCVLHASQFALGDILCGRDR